MIRNPRKPYNAVVPLKISYYKFSTNLPSSSTRTSSDYIFCHNIGGVRYTDFTLQSIPFYDIKIVQAVKLKPRWAGLGLRSNSASVKWLSGVVWTTLNNYSTNNLYSSICRPTVEQRHQPCKYFGRVSV